MDTPVTDRSDLRKYRIELPNMADDADLDPYEFRLLVHYKRVGTCIEGLETTARKCHMSSGKVSKVRQSLSDKKWITLERVELDAGRYRYRVTVIDRWNENFSMYSGMRKHKASHGEGSPSQGEGSPSYGEGGPSQGEDSPSHGESSPSQGEGGPSQGEGGPSQGEGSPSYGEGGPSQGEGSPSHGESSPSYGEGSPSPREGKNKPIKNQPIKNEPIKNERYIAKTNFQKIWEDLEQLCGTVSSDTSRLIDIWLEKHTFEHIQQAIAVSRERGARSAKYVDQVMIGWEANGYPPSRSQQIFARAFKPRRGQNGEDKPRYKIPEYSEAELVTIAKINSMSDL